MSSRETKQNKIDLRFAGKKIAKLLKPVASTRGKAKYPSEMTLCASPVKVAGGKRNFSRYIPIVLASVAVAALIPFLGLVGQPESENPESEFTPSDLETTPDGPKETPLPSSSELELFSCRSAFELAKTLPFTIDTNSTINSFNLSGKTRELEIVVHGPDGTVGVFCINVPKTMFGDKLKVFLDDLPVDANIQDYGENNIVTLMYSHDQKGGLLREPEKKDADEKLPEEPEFTPELELRQLNYTDEAGRVTVIVL